MDKNFSNTTHLIINFYIFYYRLSFRLTTSILSKHVALFTLLAVREEGLATVGTPFDVALFKTSHSLVWLILGQIIALLASYTPRSKT